MLRERVLCAIAAGVLIAWPACAPGEPPRTMGLREIAPPTKFAATLDEAREEARRTQRPLVVFRHREGCRCMRSFENPTVAAFVRSHFVAVKVPSHAACCTVKVYLNDREIPQITTSRPSSPLVVLSKLDMALERLKAENPAWWLQHQRQNPPPEPPPMPGPFHLRGIDEAAAVEDPPPEDGTVSLWDRLESARRAVRVGDYRYATGLYTWLWERGAEIDPAFGPARRSVIASEMAQLGDLRPESRDRFTAIREGRSARLLWAEYDELREWAILNGVVRDQALTVEYFDLFMNDAAEAAMIPTAHKTAYEAMLARADFADPWELMRDPVAALSRLAAYIERPRPVIIPHEEWEALRVFLRKLLLEECCRVHAACLRAGREADADAAAAVLLRADGSAVARLALVSTALAAGTPRPSHLRMLEEAERAGGGDPGLRARVEAALRVDEPDGGGAPNSPTEKRSR